MSTKRISELKVVEFLCAEYLSDDLWIIFLCFLFFIRKLTTHAQFVTFIIQRFSNFVNLIFICKNS